MDKLYTVQEAAEMLGLRPDTLRKWLREGRMPGVKLSEYNWRVKESDLKIAMSGEREAQK